MKELPSAQVWAIVSTVAEVTVRTGLHDVPTEFATPVFPLVKLVEKEAPVVLLVSVTFELAAKATPAGAVKVKVRLLPVELAMADVGLTVIVPEPLVAAGESERRDDS